MTNRKSYMRFRLVPKSMTLSDLEWPWTAKTHSVAEKMRLLEPTAQMWMKIDPYYQRQKCRPMNLVSGDIRFMGIFAGVPLGGGVKWQWGCRRRQILAVCVAASTETSEIKPAILHGDMLPGATPCLPVVDCKINDLDCQFHVKIRFWRARLSRATFALARLSCST